MQHRTQHSPSLRLPAIYSHVPLVGTPCKPARKISIPAPIPQKDMIINAHTAYF
jgi:hypothetical protein